MLRSRLKRQRLWLNLHFIVFYYHVNVTFPYRPIIKKENWKTFGKTPYLGQL